MVEMVQTQPQPQPSKTSDLICLPLNFQEVRLELFNFAADQLINGSLRDHQCWEPWQLNLMRRIIKPGFTCVDVGANIGINALFMGRCCPGGRVFAYEPFGSIYHVLERNIEHNGLTNVTAINKGLSDSTSSLEMVTDMRFVGGAHVAETSFANIQNDNYALSVAQFARLDDQMREHGVRRIDFMKIDVEGHELKVLDGAEPFLRDEDLQLTIEFAPMQLYRADLNTGPFVDRILFNRLKARFRHLFYMSRDNTLIEMHDWHSLRLRLLGGYFVDDLYCVNKIREEVAELVQLNAAPVAPQVQTTREQIGSATVVYANRDPDGWGMSDSDHAGVVGITIQGARGKTLTLKFSPMHRKHLPNGAAYPNWNVWVAIGDSIHTVNLLDATPELPLLMDADVLHVTIQSERLVSAAEYLGNPNDPRKIGFHAQVV
jgi:FkbM family methyltransferase